MPKSMILKYDPSSEPQDMSLSLIFDAIKHARNDFPKEIYIYIEI